MSDITARPASLKHHLAVFHLLGFAVLAAICVLGNARLTAARDWLHLYPLLLLATYPAMYLAPAVLSSALAAKLGGTRRLVAGVSIVALATVAILLHGDLTLYALYGFHFNAFVWNVVSTPGGMASLGFDQLSVASLAAILGAAVALVGGLWLLAGGVARRVRVRVAPLLVLFLLLTLGERGVYAVGQFVSDGEVLDLAASFPLYQPAKAAGLLERLGYQRKQAGTVRFAAADKGAVHYPLTPLAIRPGVEPPNIILLVVESLRADMLTPEIMPKLWQFSSGALRLTHHYSGGNGTRQGLFALFYGLYGNNWDRFLQDRTRPALFSVLDQYRYQRLAITSASFTYPEFDQTIFAGFRPDELVQDGAGAPWERDVRNVDRLLASLPAGQGAGARPWFRFMFFESTHARYDFPDSAVIRPDYLKDVDYLKLTPAWLREHSDAFRNRYINAAHHIDTQIGRVLDAFVASGMARNTVLVVTGDHGEAFMEHGRWGHNSDFTDEQVRVPFVMAIPGQAPAVIGYPTSHLDLVATLMPLLGVETPTDRYTLGTPLLAEQGRLVVVSSWNDIGIISPEAKIVVPFGPTTQHANLLTSNDDHPLDGRAFPEFLPLVKTALARANSFTVRSH